MKFKLERGFWLADRRPGVPRRLRRGAELQAAGRESPENFRFAESQNTNSLADLPWWQVFKDPMLQDLVRTALTNNYDLKQAVARVEQARNLAVAARSAFFPQIGYGGNVGRAATRFTTRRRPWAAPPQVPPRSPSTRAWEIDFWGRIRRLSQAARPNISPPTKPAAGSSSP